MRSNRAEDPGQLRLWDDDVEPAARRTRRRRSVDLLTYEVTDIAFASRGWHPGSILFYEPARHRARGQIIVVTCGDTVRAGEYDVAWGRPVLRTDLGTLWIGPDWVIDGVVRMVEQPLLDVSPAVRTLKA